MIQPNMKRLKVTLPEGWSDETGSRSKGVFTYVRERSKSAGTLEISLADASPPSEKDLMEMAIKRVVTRNLGRLDEMSRGTCSSGTFCSVVTWSRKAPRGQFWLISNGLDLMEAAHICRAEPDQAEILEAKLIVETAEIVEE
jgi:hypothetical protein